MLGLSTVGGMNPPPFSPECPSWVMNPPLPPGCPPPFFICSNSEIFSDWIYCNPLQLEMKFPIGENCNTDSLSRILVHSVVIIILMFVLIVVNFRRYLVVLLLAATLWGWTCSDHGFSLCLAAIGALATLAATEYFKINLDRGLYWDCDWWGRGMGGCITIFSHIWFLSITKWQCCAKSERVVPHPGLNLSRA